MNDIALFDKPGHIYDKSMAWAVHRESLLESLTHCQGSHDEDDVLARIITGEYHLWFSPRAAAVTYFFQQPKFKALNGFLSGGSLEGLYEIGALAKPWAIRSGCARVYCGGRHGWLREAGAKSLGILMYVEL